MSWFKVAPDRRPFHWNRRYNRWRWNLQGYPRYIYSYIIWWGFHPRFQPKFESQRLKYSKLLKWRTTINWSLPLETHCGQLLKIRLDLYSTIFWQSLVCLVFSRGIYVNRGLRFKLSLNPTLFASSWASWI